MTAIEQTRDERIGATIRGLREIKGWNQNRLSDALRAIGLNWSQGTVSKVEMGQRAVLLRESVRLAGVLGVGVMDLVPASHDNPELGSLRAAYLDARKDEVVAEKALDAARARTRTISASMHHFVRAEAGVA